MYATHTITAIVLQRFSVGSELAPTHNFKKHAWQVCSKFDMPAVLQNLLFVYNRKFTSFGSIFHGFRILAIILLHVVVLRRQVSVTSTLKLFFLFTKQSHDLLFKSHA